MGGVSCGRPFVEDGEFRTFSKDVSPSDLIWHSDSEDRFIQVVSGTGWLFQFEDELPFELLRDDSLFIPKGIVHRIIKGSNDLKLRIHFPSLTHLGQV